MHFITLSNTTGTKFEVPVTQISHMMTDNNNTTIIVKDVPKELATICVKETAEQIKKLIEKFS